MTNAAGREVPNQFIIETPNGTYLQSYRSIIAFIPKGYNYHEGEDADAFKTVLDINKWDYSTTTGKYRNAFLGGDINDTRAKIKSGEYILANLND